VHDEAGHTAVSLANVTRNDREPSRNGGVDEAETGDDDEIVLVGK
jgi:hypothetical protein